MEWRLYREGEEPELPDTPETSSEGYSRAAPSPCYFCNATECPHDLIVKEYTMVGPNMIVAMPSLQKCCDRCAQLFKDGEIRKLACVAEKVCAAPVFPAVGETDAMLVARLAMLARIEETLYTMTGREPQYSNG